MAPGDTLIVSDEIAEQLIASSPQFKRSGSAAEMQPAAAPAAAGVPQRPAMNRSRDQWAQYADAIGVEFDDSAGRDEIIEAVRQAESGDD